MSPINPFAQFLPAPTAGPDDDSQATAPAQPPAPSTPSEDPTPPTPEPSEDDTDTALPATRKRLAPAEVESLRQDYAYARSLALSATTAEEWETVRDTEARLGREYGVSADSVHRVALGLTYPDVPGPIDVARRAQYDRYLKEREYLGASAAKARMMEPAMSGASPLVVTVTNPDGTVERYVHPAGASVAVTSGEPEVLAALEATTSDDTPESEDD